MKNLILSVLLIFILGCGYKDNYEVICTPASSNNWTTIINTFLDMEVDGNKGRLIRGSISPVADRADLFYIQWSHKNPPQKFWSKNYEPRLIIVGEPYNQFGCDTTINNKKRNNHKKCFYLNQEILNLSSISVLKTNCDEESYSIQSQFVYFWCDDTNKVLFDTNVKGIFDSYINCIVKNNPQ